MPPACGLADAMRPISIQPATAQIRPADDVDAEQHAVGAHAGQPRGLGVVADGVDVPAPGGVLRARTRTTANSTSIRIEP